MYADTFWPGGLSSQNIIYTRRKVLPCFRCSCKMWLSQNVKYFHCLICCVCPFHQWIIAPAIRLSAGKMQTSLYCFSTFTQSGRDADLNKPNYFRNGARFHCTTARRGEETNILAEIWGSISQLTLKCVKAIKVMRAPVFPGALLLCVLLNLSPSQAHYSISLLP